MLSPQAYLPTCEIEKQPLNGVSCTDNRFYVTLEKFLINYPWQRVISETLQM